MCEIPNQIPVEEDHIAVLKNLMDDYECTIAAEQLVLDGFMPIVTKYLDDSKLAPTDNDMRKWRVAMESKKNIKNWGENLAAIRAVLGALNIPA
jgi:hypothetical protein